MLGDLLPEGGEYRREGLGLVEGRDDRHGSHEFTVPGFTEAAPKGLIGVEVQELEAGDCDEEESCGWICRS